MWGTPLCHSVRHCQLPPTATPCKSGKIFNLKYWYFQNYLHIFSKMQDLATYSRCSGKLLMRRIQLDYLDHMICNVATTNGPPPTKFNEICFKMPTRANLETINIGRNLRGEKTNIGRNLRGENQYKNRWRDAGGWVGRSCILWYL